MKAEVCVVVGGTQFKALPELTPGDTLNIDYTLTLEWEHDFLRRLQAFAAICRADKALVTQMAPIGEPSPFSRLTDAVNTINRKLRPSWFRRIFG